MHVPILLPTNFNDDEVTHINIGDNSKHPLGKMLSYTSGDFSHPVFGYFKSIANYWVWLKSNFNSTYREVDPSVVWALHLTEDVNVTNFHFLTAEANWLKITSNNDLIQLLLDNNLPLVMYHWEQVEGEDRKVVNQHSKNLVQYLTLIKRQIKLSIETDTELNDKFLIKWLSPDSAFEERYASVTTN